MYLGKYTGDLDKYTRSMGSTRDLDKYTRSMISTWSTERRCQNFKEKEQSRVRTCRAEIDSLVLRDRHNLMDKRFLN